MSPSAERNDCGNQERPYEDNRGALHDKNTKHPVFLKSFGLLNRASVEIQVNRSGVSKKISA
jgi:hypothetical protein